jgi:hypothetical protein
MRAVLLLRIQMWNHLIKLKLYIKVWVVIEINLQFIKVVMSHLTHNHLSSSIMVVYVAVFSIKVMIIILILLLLQILHQNKVNQVRTHHKQHM